MLWFSCNIWSCEETWQPLLSLDARKKRREQSRWHEKPSYSFTESFSLCYTPPLCTRHRLTAGSKTVTIQALWGGGGWGQWCICLLLTRV